LKIPLPPERGGAAINFASGDVPPEKVGAAAAAAVAAAVAAGEQEPNTLIFLHTGVCEVEEHTVKDATTGQVFEEEDIEECDKCVKAGYNI